MTTTTIKCSFFANPASRIRDLAGVREDTQRDREREHTLLTNSKAPLITYQQVPALPAPITPLVARSPPPPRPLPTQHTPCLPLLSLHSITATSQQLHGIVRISSRLPYRELPGQLPHAEPRAVGLDGRVGLVLGSEDVHGAAPGVGDR